MPTQPLSYEAMRQIEGAEVRAWRDMYAAIPAEYAERYGPELVRVEGVTLTRCRAIPFPHFNAVLDLGIAEPATEASVDAIIAAYREAGVGRFHLLTTLTRSRRS